MISRPDLPVPGRRKCRSACTRTRVISCTRKNNNVVDSVELDLKIYICMSHMHVDLVSFIRAEG